MEREKMKDEAINRLAMLQMHPDVLKSFKKDVLYYSERSPLGGILYWLDNNPEWPKIVSDLEEEHNILVYHATHERTEFGELLDLLYVSSYEEEWAMDRDNIREAATQNGQFFPIAYTVNLSDPLMSEFGSVGMRAVGGGLVRTH